MERDDKIVKESEKAQFREESRNFKQYVILSHDQLTTRIINAAADSIRYDDLESAKTDFDPGKHSAIVEVSISTAYVPENAVQYDPNKNPDDESEFIARQSERKTEPASQEISAESNKEAQGQSVGEEQAATDTNKETPTESTEEHKGKHSKRKFF